MIAVPPTTRDLVLAAAARLAAEGREVSAVTIAGELGLGKRTVASPLKRLRAAGLVPRNPRAGRKARAEARPRKPPAAPPSTVWPPGRPEEWDPAIACLYYRREWRRIGKSA